jgi:hypothetical protein
MEIQILDDGAARYQGRLKPAQYHGSIYDVVPAKQGFKKPTGEWNSEEITANGRSIQHPQVAIFDSVINWISRSISALFSFQS